MCMARSKPISSLQNVPIASERFNCFTEKQFFTLGDCLLCYYYLLLIFMLQCSFAYLLIMFIMADGVCSFSLLREPPDWHSLGCD